MRTLIRLCTTQSGFDALSVDHDNPQTPSASPRSTARRDSVVLYPITTLNFVPSTVLRIFGSVAELPVAPVAATVTSLVLACSMVLIGLVCQVAQMFCCLEMLPTDSSLRGSNRAAGLP